IDQLLLPETRTGARSCQRVLGGRTCRGPALWLLLLSDGLAPSRWCAVCERRASAPALRRLYPRPDSRTLTQLRQARRPVVRRRLAARCARMGIAEDERYGAPTPAGYPRQQPEPPAGRLRHTRAGDRR